MSFPKGLIRIQDSGFRKNAAGMDPGGVFLLNAANLRRSTNSEPGAVATGFNLP